MLLLTAELQPATDNIKYPMESFGDEWKLRNSRHEEQILGHGYPWDSIILHCVSTRFEEELFLTVYAH